MGNRLVLHQKVVKIEKPDGNILEYKAPIKVDQILSKFKGHALSDSLHSFQHLLPETKLLVGKIYYLIPLPLPSSPPKKKVRFSIPENDAQETRAVRVKLVISKQELQKMLQNGRISVDMISKLQDQHNAPKFDTSGHGDDHKGWKPRLNSIPEIDPSLQAT